MERKRVVITGMGTVNPLGNSVQETWDALMAKRSGIDFITAFDTSRIQTKFAGEVKNFDYTQHFEGDMVKKAKRMGRFCHLAAAAAAEAIASAGLDDVDGRERIGVTVGSGVGAMEIHEANILAKHERGPRRMSPFYIPMTIGNMASGMLSMMHGWRGPNIGLQTACATGNHSIAVGLMIIRSGMADIMVTGGTESACMETAVAAFGNMQALSTRNDSPQTASRPFDKDRDGFVLSEGAGILVLEEYEHARARGANIFCEVLSCGMSGDAHDFVATDPEGRGAELSMRMAVDQAGIDAGELKYVNAHGTSTPIGDVSEAKAVHDLIGDSECYIASTKSYHGHLLGAAAGIEAIITAEAMLHSTVPANINLFNPDPALPPLNLPTDAIETEIPYALSNSFGFGGHNSSLILGKI